ncbi:hypothetical protein SNEBB_003135 [Seison nebaliae]|nr:hypothetical protein SNEBB_003135 [Seison nebaliae]
MGRSGEKEKDVEKAKAYLAEKRVPQLFEGMMTALMLHQPADHIEYLQSCLKKVKNENISSFDLDWDTFIKNKPGLNNRTVQSPGQPSARKEMRTEDNEFGRVNAQTVHGRNVQSPKVLPSIQKQDKEEIEHSRPVSMKSNQQPLPQIDSAKTYPSPPAPLIFVIGSPGVVDNATLHGLAAKYKNKFCYINLFNILDGAAKMTKDPRFVELDRMMDNGELVPTSIVLELVSRSIAQHQPIAQLYVVRGFPKSLEQLHQFERSFGQSADMLVHLWCDEKTSQDRVITLGSERSKKNLSKKHQVYQKQTMPVVKHFEEEKRLLSIDLTENLEPLEQFVQYIDKSMQKPSADDNMYDNNADDEMIQKESVVVAGIVTGGPHTRNLDGIPLVLYYVEVRDNHRPFFDKKLFSNCPLVTLVGPKGSGKSSLAKKLANDYDYETISLEDMLEGASKGNDELANRIKEAITKKEEIPAELVIDLMQTSMNDGLLKNHRKRFVLDDILTTKYQVDEFMKQGMKISSIISLEGEKQIFKDRLSSPSDDYDAITDKYAKELEEAVKCMEEKDNECTVFQVNAERSLDDTYLEITDLLEKTVHLDDNDEEMPSISRNLTDCTVVVITGGPGSGKGTQCDKIVEKYHYIHLSTGDILREEAKKPENAELNKVMTSGQLVSLEIILGLLKKRMKEELEKAPKGKPIRYLLDGFPREVAQAQKLKLEVTVPQLVISLECSDDTLTQRLLNRGKTSGRADDNESTIRKRLNTFHESTKPVLQYYEKEKSTEVKSLEAEGKPEDIFVMICSILDELHRREKQ